MISVIIPMYNSRDTIRNCLKSVIDQTFADLEIIVIDDGSTDNGGEIVKDIAAKDGRIRYIRKDNGGVSSARNRGLDESRGEYICFVDSDDVITIDYVASMYTKMQETQSDIVMCGYCEVCKDKMIRHVLSGSVLSQLQGKMVTDFYALRSFTHSPCFKVFRNEVINHHHLRFREDMVLAEDQYFNFQYYEFCKTVAFVNAPNYIYLRQDSSLSSTITVHTNENEAENLICMTKYFDNNGIERGELITAFYVCYCLRRYIFIPGESNTRADVYKRMKKLNFMRKHVKLNNRSDQLIYDLLYFRQYFILFILKKGKEWFDRRHSKYA